MAGDIDEELDTEPVEDDLEELSDDAMLEDELVEPDLDDELVDDDEVDDVPDVDEVVVAVVPEGDESLGEDDDDDLDDDDVEASLDVILKERLVVPEEEDDDDDDEDGEPADSEDRGEGNMRVLPKQPGEFVCQSCFLVKSEKQLADKKRRYCRDCV